MLGWVVWIPLTNTQALYLSEVNTFPSAKALKVTSFYQICENWWGRRVTRISVCSAWPGHPPLAHRCPCAAVPKLLPGRVVLVTMEELKIFQRTAGNVASWDYRRNTQKAGFVNSVPCCGLILLLLHTEEMEINFYVCWLVTVDQFSFSCAFLSRISEVSTDGTISYVSSSSGNLCPFEALFPNELEHQCPRPAGFSSPEMSL